MYIQLEDFVEFFSDVNSIMSLTHNLHSNAILEYEEFNLPANTRTQVLFLEEAYAHRSVSKEIGFEMTIFEVWMSFVSLLLW